MLQSINESIQGDDQELKEAVTKHADYEIMASFPGSATKTQARMIAALGDDRSQAVKRALAYKWMRIIFRCWKEGVCYDEAKYLQRLKATQSPLADLPTASKG